jgi:hypothetical protein
MIKGSAFYRWQRTIAFETYRCFTLKSKSIPLPQHDTQDFIPSDDALDEGASLAIQHFAFTPIREGREALTFKY